MYKYPSTIHVLSVGIFVPIKLNNREALEVYNFRLFGSSALFVSAIYQHSAKGVNSSELVLTCLKCGLFSKNLRLLFYVEK